MCASNQIKQIYYFAPSLDYDFMATDGSHHYTTPCHHHQHHP